MLLEIEKASMQLRSASLASILGKSEATGQAGQHRKHQISPVITVIVSLSSSTVYTYRLLYQSQIHSFIIVHPCVLLIQWGLPYSPYTHPPYSLCLLYIPPLLSIIQVQYRKSFQHSIFVTSFAYCLVMFTLFSVQSPTTTVCIHCVYASFYRSMSVLYNLPGHSEIRYPSITHHCYSTVLVSRCLMMQWTMRHSTHTFPVVYVGGARSPAKRISGAL